VFNLQDLIRDSN
jgi:hypothetical protein